MKHVRDILTVSFDSSLEDKSALCVSRKIGDQITVLKMELDEQADILYRILTEQMTKVDIKKEKVGSWIRVDKDKLKCSKCEVIHFIAQYPQSAKINYCPNCGTRMSESEG